MRPGARSGLAVVVATMVLSLAAGCGSDDAKADPTMTPHEANQAMRQMAADVMTAAVPDEDVALPASNTPIPCGGPEGSEYTRVKYGVLLQSRQALESSDDAFGAARAKLTELGYEVDPVETMGTTTSMAFHGDAAGGSLVWHGSGPLALNVETDCLDNPDRDAS